MKNVVAPRGQIYLCMDCGERSKNSSSALSSDATWVSGGKRCPHSFIRVYEVPDSTGKYIPVERNLLYTIGEDDVEKLN